MAVSSVNFSNTGMGSFQDIVNRPAMYSKQNKPVSATVIYKEQPKKKGGALKKVIIGAVALFAALALGVKNKEAIKNSAPVKKLLENEKVGNFLKKKPVQTVKNGAEKIGTAICNLIGKGVNFVKSHIPAEKAGAADVSEGIKEAVEDVAKTVAEG